MSISEVESVAVSAGLVTKGADWHFCMMRRRHNSTQNGTQVLIVYATPGEYDVLVLAIVRRNS